jgi:hypothetical protein
METIDRSNNDEVRYTVFNPNDSNNSHHFIVKLNDNASINKYKEFVKSEIKHMNEMGPEHIDSSTHYIAIHKIQVNCFYLSDVGSGRGRGVIVDKLCKSECAFSYTGKYDICWFAIPVFFEYYSKDPKAKRIDSRKLESETIKKWQEFYKVEGTPLQPKVRDLLSGYPGFNPEGEIESFIEHFKLPSIQVFSYNMTSQRYETGFVYKCKDHKERGEDYTGDFVRVAIVQVERVKLHSGEKDQSSLNHVIFLKDLSFLNLRVCEKCNYRVFDMTRYKNTSHEGTNPNYFTHVQECDGKRPEKRLRVSEVELPICPGMLYDSTWLYLKAYDRMKDWKPDDCFMTYDLETVETPVPHNKDSK